MREQVITDFVMWLGLSFLYIGWIFLLYWLQEKRYIRYEIFRNLLIAAPPASLFISALFYLVRLP